MEALEQALKIAILALDGQRDKDGQPEMLHNVMVGFAGQNEVNMKNKIFILLALVALCSCCETSGLGGGSSSKVAAYIRQPLLLLSPKQTSCFGDPICKFLG